MLLNEMGCIVIGEEDGLGHSLAAALATQGYHVAFGNTSEQKDTNQRTVDDPFVTIAADLSSAECVEAFFWNAYDCLPEFYVLLNCEEQNVRDRSHSLSETTLADWEAFTLKTLRRFFLLSQQAVEGFMSYGKGGRIIHVLSTPTEGKATSVHQETVNSAIYAGVRSIAKEYGRANINCNAVFVKHVQAESGQKTFSSNWYVPPFYLAQPEEIINTILFLASPQASFVTGEMFHLLVASL